VSSVPDAGVTAEEPDRRGYAVALGLVGIGALLVLLGYGRTWAHVVVADPGLPSLSLDLTGRDLEPAGAATAVLALAGIAGLVATRRVGRVVAGALLVLAGAGAGLAALTFGLGRRDGVLALASERAGVDVVPDVTVTWWWLLAVVGGSLVLLGGLLAVVRGGTWPQMGSRYERAAASGEGPAPARGGAESSWDQLDRGLDPTAVDGDGMPDPALGRDTDD
jgi:uncharacterized membrane protein (TIGR02234 family)